jgi:membrane fusion protein, copper/silver efflux system
MQSIARSAVIALSHVENPVMSADPISPTPPPSDPAVPENHGFWHNAWQVLKTLQARLRFFFLLAIIGIVVGSWTTISAYWEKWTRPLLGQEQEAESDVEYFCPMHPYIIRDNPKEKCPICHMDLAKRKKASVQLAALPPGTVSRVQLTPYRVLLAGVQTTKVEYLPLSKEIVTVGTVEFDETRHRHIAARQKGIILNQHVNYTGQMVEKGEELATLDVRFSPELTATLDDLLRARRSGDKDLEQAARKRLRVWDLNDEQIDETLRTGKLHTRLKVYSPIKGHVTRKYQKEGAWLEEGAPLYDVADLSTVWVEAQIYEVDQNLVKKGQKVQATTLAGPGEPPLEGRISFVNPHLDPASRTLQVRFEFPNNETPDHGHKLRPGSFATVRIAVPPAEIGVVSEALVQDWAEENTLEAIARSLAFPSGRAPTTGLGPLLRLAGRQAALRSESVLAVPESAVIDTGDLRIVYREAGHDLYDGVSVRLGPRMAGKDGSFYPVLQGLDAGDNVVTSGSFLIDAETRLNPAAGSIYYGGGGGKGESSSAPVRPSTPSETPEPDKRIIAEQRICPITGKALGSMGPPAKVTLSGTAVFLCCDGCEDEAKSHQAATLKKLGELKGKSQGK